MAVAGGRNLSSSPRLASGASLLEYVLKPVAVIDKTLPVIDLPDARPFASGNGPHDYLCGTCRNVLLSKIELPKPQRVIVVCGKCRTPNLMEATADGTLALEP